MHKFKKAFGQNFLRNDRFAKQLVDALEPQSTDLIIEVGPGDGRVTNLLLQTEARITAVEVDYSLVPKLIMRFREQPNFKLLHQDVLELDITELLENQKIQTYKVTGSLPYNISKQIIAKFVQQSPRPQRMSFIVQEEVAKVYAAQAPKATFLSNWLGIRADIKKLVSIPASQFFPIPKVNGAILVIEPKEKLLPEQTKQISKLLKVAYTSPRKTLRNNLQAGWHSDEQKEVIDQIFTELKLSQTIRPAELTMDQWQNLAGLLTSNSILK